MESPNEAAAVSRTSLWIGRILSLVLVLFLIFDGVTKILKIPPVIKAAAQLGFSVRQIVGIGILLLVCTAVYIIPRTSVLGAILLAAYLGGATVTNLRAGDPLILTIAPAVFGVLLWLGLYLRDRRLRALIPLRS